MALTIPGTRSSMLTGGLGVGIIGAAATGALGERWWQDPRVAIAGIVWLFNGLLLGLRSLRGMRGGRIARLTVAGFALALLALALAPGLHAKPRDCAETQETESTERDN